MNVEGFICDLSSIQKSKYIRKLLSDSRTLTGIVFTIVISKSIISSNVTVTISDHLPQFLILCKTFADTPSNKPNAFERDWSIYDYGNFLWDYFIVD